MKTGKLQFGSKHTLTAAFTAAASIAALIVAAPNAAAQTKGMTSDQVFKNVRVLKGLTVDDFMDTMGVMTSSLSFDCSDCHIGAGTDKVDWAADTQRKVIARKMVTMVQAINRDNFSGRQVVTCYSCHHGRDRPATTAPLEFVYGPPSTDTDDVIAQAEGAPPADQIIERYIKAIGGAERLAQVKSFVATGSSVGFGGYGGGAVVTMSAKAPDLRSLVIDFKNAPGRGDTTRNYDGHTGWIRTPLNVLGEYELEGAELDGARLDALMSFPGNIKQFLTKLRVGVPASISDLPAPSSQVSKEDNVLIGQDRLVNVVQGNGPHDMLVTLYFAQDSGLLLRVLRYAKSPIGRMPTQIDLADYRDVGNGVKMPFRMTFAWPNGRDEIRFSQYKLNVPIDPKVFGRPAPLHTTAADK